MGATCAGKTGSLLHVLSFSRIVFSSGAVLNPPQQHQREESHSNDDGSIDPGSDVQQDQDSLSQREHLATDMATEDTEVYQRRIRELEHELENARRDNGKLVCLLNEIDQLVLPELSECVELRLSERLRVYLECLFMEKQELEGRAFTAERTVEELEHTVAVLQGQLQDATCSLAQPGESQQHASSSPQPSPTQSSSRFFFKINKKSAEKITASNLQKQGDAVLPKQKLKKRLVKIHRQVLSKPAAKPRKVCLSKVEGQFTEHKQDLSPTMSSSEADSRRSTLQFPEASVTDKNQKSGASGDEHGSINEDDEDNHVHKRVPEEDTLSTASTLSMMASLNLRSRDEAHEFLDHSSVNQDRHIKDPMLLKFEIENFSGSSKDAFLLSGEKCKENENHECIAKKPTDSTGHSISQKPEVPVDFLQPAVGITKSTRNPQLTSLVAEGILEDDSLSFSTVCKCDDPVALKPTTGHILPAEEMLCSFSLLQVKPEEAASMSKKPVSPVKTGGGIVSGEK
ncbi:uncharacterized protein LOC116516327 [Thamnophis elegans]|uniref:uncharacterized protein LOC116516327 n=1 Tax=Thamnophis elegans TaxID=35005 RepID=UPI001376682C|nr:uncharacterized protein LOC116516327 [Thamnophis elegans]